MTLLPRPARRRLLLLALALLAPSAFAAEPEAPAPTETEETPATITDEIEVTTPAPGLGGVTATGSRLGLTQRETPASVEVLESTTFRLRGDWTGLEAVTRATGIASSPTGGNGGTALSARGFVGHGSVMQLYDGGRLYVGAGTMTFPVDSWTFARIEVLRGPASVLYGEGAIGAAVNYVPRRPQATPEHRVTATAGSDETYRLGLSTTGPLSPTVRYKLDVSGTRGDGVVDRGESDRAVVSAALAWQPRESLELSLDFDDASVNDAPYWGTPLLAGRLDERLRERNFNVADGEIRYDDTWIRQRTTYRAGTVTLQNELYHLTADRHWRNLESYAYDAATGRIDRSDPLEIFHDQRQTGNRLSASLSRSWLGVEHRLAGGFDVNRIAFDHTNNSPFRAPEGVSLAVDPFRFEPGFFQSADATTPGFETRTDQFAFFVEDSFQLGERTRVVLGARHDRAELDRTDLRVAARSFDRTFDATTWRLGVVHDVTPESALYGQIGTAVDPLGSLITTSFAQRDFELAEGRQVELGWKQRLAGGRGEWTLAAYRIEKTNLLTRDPLRPAVTLQIGEQSSTGLELWSELVLGRGFRLEANAAALDARFEEFSENVGGVPVSRRGRTPIDVPERLANLWLTWAACDGWQAGAGLRHVGRRFADSANRSELPDYQTLDAFVSWQVRPRLGITLRGKNLTDELYALAPYNGGTQWVLGAPRAVEVSFATGW
jgi:iron complex outermembrane receptor protein